MQAGWWDREGCGTVQKVSGFAGNIPSSPPVRGRGTAIGGNQYGACVFTRSFTAARPLPPKQKKEGLLSAAAAAREKEHQRMPRPLAHTAPGAATVRVPRPPPPPRDHESCGERAPPCAPRTRAAPFPYFTTF
eukprot:gene19117-biopygen22017